MCTVTNQEALSHLPSLSLSLCPSLEMGCRKKRGSHKLEGARPPGEAAAAASGLDQQSPLDHPNLFSTWTYSWVTPMISLGRKKQLKIEDVFQLPKDLDPRSAISKFNAEWEREVAKVGPEKASLAKCLIRAYLRGIIGYMVVVTFFIGFSIVGPVYFFRKLTNFIAADGSNIGYGVGMAFGIIFSEAIRSLFINMFWLSAARVSVNFRSIVFSTFHMLCAREC